METKVMTNILNPRGLTEKINSAVEMIEDKPYSLENKHEKLFARLGMWFFPVLIVTLTGFGVGKLLTAFVPAWLAYTLAFAFAILIEFGQAVFVRPLAKQIAKKSKIRSGLVFRVVGFTLISLILGGLGFYSWFLDSEKTTLTDNTAKVNRLTDSIQKLNSARCLVLTEQLDQLKAARAKRWGGMLRENETQLQTQLTNQLLKNDSLAKAEIMAVRLLYPTEAKPTNWTFSPDGLLKILGAALTVLVLGFLTVFSHYLDYKHAYNVAKEGTTLLTNDKNREQLIVDDIAANNITAQYMQVLKTFREFQQAQFTPLNAGYQVAAQHTQQPEPDRKVITGFNRTNENRKNENSVSENTKVCNHCGGTFTSNHKKQIYCCDACRIANYEQRTGRKLSIKRK